MIGDKVNFKQSGDMEDDVRAWFYKIDRGIDARSDVEDRWSINEAFADMCQWSDDGLTFRPGNYDEPTINKISSYISTSRAALFFKAPTVKRSPTDASGWEPVTVPRLGADGQPVQGPNGVQAKTFPRYILREKLLNSIISKPLFNLPDTIARVIQAERLGYGAAMVGYAPTFGTAPEKDTDSDEITINDDGTLDLEGFHTHPLTGLPIIGDNGKAIKTHHLPVWEEWFIDWVHYRRIIIDPDGGNDFMKHRWVALEEVRTLEEVKADPLFKNTKDLQATGTLLRERQKEKNKKRDTYDSLQGLADRDDLKTVRLFFIFDKVKDRMIVLADGHGKALFDEPMPLGITDSPLCFYRTNEIISDVESFYQRPKVTELIPLVSENNQLRRMAFLYAKRAVVKILAEKGMFPPEEADKLSNDVNMELVYYEKKGQYAADKAATMLTPPPLSMDVWNTLRANAGDFDEISGQGAASRGKMSTETATAVQQRGTYEAARYDYDRLVLKRFLIECFKKLDDSIDANMTVPRAVQLIGDDGQAFVGLVDRDMIACDGDIDFDVEDMAPVDGEAEAARTIQFIQVIGQNPWIAANEAVLRGFTNKLKIKDENLIAQLPLLAQMQMQAAMQPKVPNAAPPQDEAMAMQQSGGGTQIPQMQGRA